MEKYIMITFASRIWFRMRCAVLNLLLVKLKQKILIKLFFNTINTQIFEEIPILYELFFLTFKTYFFLI